MINLTKPILLHLIKFLMDFFFLFEKGIEFSSFQSLNLGINDQIYFQKILKRFKSNNKSASSTKMQSSGKKFQ